jgi:hypothetical protein
VVELRLLVKRQRTGAAERCSHDATAACQEKSERRKKPCEQGALAQKNRRSVRENAPLKNRFSKRSRSGWTGVPFAKATKLRLIRSRDEAKDVNVRSE